MTTQPLKIGVALSCEEKGPRELQQVGGHQEEAYRFLQDQVLPHLSASS